MDAGDAAERLVREEGARVLATLIRVTGDIDLAQDAVVRALERWPHDGVPDNPRAWLTVTAKRRAIDLVRREAQRAGKEVEAVSLLDPTPEPAEVVRDDLLRLIFTCCHPALSAEAQVALSLRTLGGLSTAQVARGLLVPEATMAKRLTRAKQKITQARIPYRVPAAEELPGRLAAVAATIYLIFNEGYAAGAGADLVRVALTDEAVRLARLLAELMPDEPTVLGLLALLLLLLLHDARRAAAWTTRAARFCYPTRTGPDGTPRRSRRAWSWSAPRCAVPPTGPIPTWCRRRSRPATRWPPPTPTPIGMRSSPGTTCCSACRTPRWCGSTGRWPWPNYRQALALGMNDPQTEYVRRRLAELHQ
jgi:RNA polymerase sigma factor (sigma-70 family)